MDNAARYTVGIDLGTTNSALAYVDTSTAADSRRVEILEIPQLVAAGEIEALPVLPSFIYLPEGSDEVPDALCLPWHRTPPDRVCGTYARARAADVPSKVVASAKSWLCYEGIDRRAACLPYDRTPVPRQISPVDASRCILEHLRDAWDWRMAADDHSLRLENQDVYLTVPASFDAVARELTVEAAAAAGLNVRLLEEPQAAFYAWLQVMGDRWRDHVGDGDVILVCDMGGGTSDFSLIAVVDRGGDLELQRIAVGDHILLGGDNMDLTLAYGMARRLRLEHGIELDAYQLAALTHACRQAKERLGAGAADRCALTVLGRGSSVVGGTITTHIDSADLRDFLLDGFFPSCSIDAVPAARRRAGLRTFGLDYASDPALTKHLAAFLSRHGFRNAQGQPMMPTAVLFNGGVTKSDLFRNRIAHTLEQWNAGNAGAVDILTRHDPDLAVATGAAWYGNVKRIGGVRIKAGSPRSYYIGVESSLPAVPGFAPPMEALCVVSFGLEEGSEVDVQADDLGLLVGEATEFRFFSSTQRPDDAIGQRLPAMDSPGLEELPPVTTELRADEVEDSPIGNLVPVTLRTVLTEIGTLELWCDATRGNGTWKLEFELRQEEEHNG